MKIQAADNIRGELVFASVNRSIRANQTIALPDAAFWNDDIQRMRKAGRIIVIDGPDEEKVEDEYVMIQNIHRKPLVLTCVPDGLRPGEAIRINRLRLQDADVQTAKAIGLIRELDEEERAEFPDDITRALRVLEGDDADEAIDIEVTTTEIEEPMDEAEAFNLKKKAILLGRMEEPSKPKETYIYDPRPSKPKQMKNSFAYDPYKAREYAAIEAEQAEAKAAALKSRLTAKSSAKQGVTPSPKAKGAKASQKAPQKTAAKAPPKLAEKPSPKPANPAAQRLASKGDAARKSIRPVGRSRSSGGGSFDGDGVDIERL